ncbi:hypothetical protein [Gemmata sp.]|uniref:hypothetical protein n=1 Tax=Gemmata sp. TaxID=1914242 RepID=UPI003F730E80
MLVGFLIPLSAGCAAMGHHAGVLATAASGPDVPPAVVRNDGEFDDFLDQVRGRPEPGTNDPDSLVVRLEASRPNFDRQVVVLVRHDASSGSTFGFSTRTRGETLVCDIQTRRVGTVRDHRPYWFAVAVDRPGPERVEVRVDGQPQPSTARTGP